MNYFNDTNHDKKGLDIFTSTTNRLLAVYEKREMQSAAVY